MRSPKPAPPPSPDRLALKPAEAARSLGISPRTLWLLTNKGDVPHVRLGRRLLYQPDALKAWLASRQTGGNR